MSGDMSELQDKMSYRRRKARLRDIALDGFALTAFALCLGCGAFLFWH